MDALDTHLHLWHAGNLPPWLSDPSLSRIAVTRGVDEYCAAGGDASGAVHGDLAVRRAIYMEVDVAPEDREAEAAEVAALVADPANLLVGAVIGAPIVDGTVAEFEAYARRWAAAPGIVGVRQVLHVHPKGTCLRDAVVAKAKLCGELGLVFELCMKCDELDDAAALAAAAPDTRFVLDHCGGHHQLVAGAPEALTSAWRAGIAACSAQRNVWCKVSGLLGAQGGADGLDGAAAWSPERQAVTCEHVLATFAADRVLFGSDWPVCTLTAPVSSWAACVATLARARSRDDAERLLFRNAEVVYRLAAN